MNNITENLHSRTWRYEVSPEIHIVVEQDNHSKDYFVHAESYREFDNTWFTIVDTNRAAGISASNALFEAIKLWDFFNEEQMAKDKKTVRGEN